MANAFGDSIEAVLKLDATKFDTGISKAINSLDQFKTSSTSVERLNTALVEVIDSLERLNGVSRRNIELFNTLGNAIHKMGLGLKLLQSDSIDVEQAVNTMNNIFKAFQGTLSSVTLKLENVRGTEKKLEEATRTKTEAQKEAIATLNANRTAVMGLITGNSELSASEEKVASSSTRASSSLRNQSTANRTATTSTNQLTSATNRLSQAMSSLKMIGSLVGSMLAYNFAHKLLVATGETIHAKSEMEGYFKMLRFSQSDIDQFNQALDRTVAQFQRVNKYSLGETISSIGVEFNLTTQEMEKAMRVTSMITSEYLRAGRNANEASLAVKDVLQGQFQRLSRETGVKGEQLKEAGWSGDTTDVLGLMEALEKVGESRNWDVFAEKANSLNDILTISQNRFGEWSAELVNVVQPTILSVFNSFLSFSQGVAQGLTSIWEWLNTDGWGQTAIKIGAVGTALLTTSQMLVMYRTNMGLVEASQLGLKKTLVSLVLGLKGQELAEIGVRNAILSKILGVKAETLAESGVTKAISEKLTMSKLETIQEKLNTLSSEENTTAKMKNAIQKRLQKALDEELIAEEEFLTLQQQLNTIVTEEQTIANGGLVASLYLLGTGEELATGTTIGLSEAMGVLNGVFMLSPVGWLTAGILALAGAFYVLSGGLSDVWSKMKEFNEAIDSGYDYLKPYQQQMSKLEEEGKANTEEYNNLNSALQTNKRLIQEGTAQKNRAEEQYQGLNATLDEHLQKLMKENNLSQETIDNTTSLSKAVELGKKKYYSAMQVMTKQTQDFDNDTDALVKTMQKQKKSSDEISESLASLSGHYADLETHSYIANTTDDWWEWLWNSFYAGMDQFWIDWEMFWADPQWDTALQGLWKGINLLMPWTNLINEVSDTINEKGLVGWIMDSIDGGSGDEIVDFLHKYIAKPIGDWINWFIEDPSAHFDEVSNDLSLGIAKFLFGKDTDTSIRDMIDQWLKDNIVKPLEDSINDFLSNPLDFIGEGKFTFGGIGVLTSILPKLLFGEDAKLNDIKFDPTGTVIKWVSSWVGNFFDQLVDGFTNHSKTNKTINIADILRNIIDFGSDALSKLIQDIVNLFSDGLTNAIKNIPVVGDVASFLGLGEDAESSAQSKGESVGQSYSSGVQTGISGLDGIINGALEGLGLDDITSQFMNNSNNIVSTATSTASNVSNSFNTMRNNQKSALDSMVSRNTTAFHDMKTSSNNSMIQMRDSTSHVTSQMTNAWKVMKDNIIASADKIQTESTSRFTNLSHTIGTFYRNIQNPSNWGATSGMDKHMAGSRSLRSHNPSPRSRTVGRAVFGGGFGGGYTGKDNMSISSLKKMICPNGDCGNIFDGYSLTDVVNVPAFLSSIGLGHGFGGWNFADKHNSFIKSTSDKWDTAPPIIQLLSGIHTSTKFKVGEFNNGTPKISFNEFVSMAEAIFSAIPYRFYYDSSWKGSWLGALQAGACNCYDGALALIAFANTCGFGGSLVHGTWTDPDGTKYPHVWASINGMKMDTTGWQQRGSWSAGGQSSRGVPTQSNAQAVNVSVVIEGDVYGITDLNSKIEEGIDKGLQKHFNRSYAVGV